MHLRYHGAEWMVTIMTVIIPVEMVGEGGGVAVS